MGEELEALRVAKKAQVPLKRHLENMPKNSQESEKEKWQTLRQQKQKNQQILELQRYKKVLITIFLKAYNYSLFFAFIKVSNIYNLNFQVIFETSYNSAIMSLKS